MLSGEDGHAIRTIGIRSSDGLFAAEGFQPNGRIAACATQSAGLQLLGSIFGSRLCATAARVKIVVASFKQPPAEYFPVANALSRRNLSLGSASRCRCASSFACCQTIAAGCVRGPANRVHAWRPESSDPHRHDVARA